MDRWIDHTSNRDTKSRAGRVELKLHVISMPKGPVFLSPTLSISLAIIFALSMRKINDEVSVVMV